MNSTLIFILLIFSAVLPVIILFIWFRIKAEINTIYFLAALACGIISLLAAAICQHFFPITGNQSNIAVIFMSVFIRIALIEESSRIVTLFPLVKFGGKYGDLSFAAHLGLAAGLGFAAVENAFYGTQDINITWLRLISAAPLHGACGIRTAAAVYKFPGQALRAVGLFLSAIIIHGAYNLIIISPIIPSYIAIPIAIISLIITLPMLKGEGE